MSADRVKKIDHEIKKLQIQIKETNLGLRNKMKDILQDMAKRDDKDEYSNGNGFMSGEQEPRF